MGLKKKKRRDLFFDVVLPGLFSQCRYFSPPEGLTVMYPTSHLTELHSWFFNWTVWRSHGALESV